MKTHLHWEFLRRCERLLLSVVSGKSPHRLQKLIIFDKNKNKKKKKRYPFNPFDLLYSLRFV